MPSQNRRNDLTACWPLRGAVRWELFGALALALLAGCRTPSVTRDLPRYPWRGAEDLVRTLDDRRPTLRTVTAEMTLIVWRKGKPVRFGGILVADLPERIRCRVYKAGQRAFDLTVDGEGYRLVRGRDGEVIERAWSAARAEHEEDALDPRVLRGVLTYLSGPVKDAGRPVAIAEDAGAVTLHYDLDDGKMRRRIDKATRVDLEVVFTDQAGEEVTRIMFESYTVIRGIPWPMLITITGHGADQKCAIRLRSVEINEPLADGAFAEKGE